jgi:hypothetical protein
MDSNAAESEGDKQVLGVGGGVTANVRGEWFMTINMTLIGDETELKYLYNYRDSNTRPCFSMYW